MMASISAALARATGATCEAHPVRQSWAGLGRKKCELQVRVKAEFLVKHPFVGNPPRLEDYESVACGNYNVKLAMA